MTISTYASMTQPLLLDVSNTTLHVITPEQFDRLCLDNPDLRLELTKDRELIVMPPTGGETGRKNSRLTAQVVNWNDRSGLGEVFDSSTGYDFTDIGGGKMSPDVSWIEQSRLVGVNIDRFIPVVPNFVIELRSKSDNLITLQIKMQEYQRLGISLGLLINPQERQVEIYRLLSQTASRSGQEVEVLDFPMSVDCEKVMPGFSLNLSRIW